jgi:type IV pilus assembly protein PilM
MAEKTGSVWAIDIGNTSLKALHLSNESGALQVIGFDHIQHGKILSGTGIKDQEKQELIALSLRQFVQQNDIGRDEIIVAVPSQNSFARFVNLPPVEQKRIPEIVKFEASQQIPFDINDVVWDWQLMTEAGATEAKVGIFAIKNDVVTAELEHFSRENLQVSYVQLAPMALYNYLLFDRPDLTHSDTQAAVVLNIGAENTDLVVCTKSDVWQRTIATGGNAFTKAIAETFKLSFEKAEKLKRTAPMSKYARQVLQAMKPVFADLVAEIQRSLGFYSSSHSNVKLARIIALGGGTKMRGLLQYLQQSLQMPIERPDSFKQVGMNAAVSAAKFHESVCDFGIVYGLGIQALGLGRIESNLLPRAIARSMVWARKTKYFVAAACIVLVVSVLAFARALIDRASYGSRSVVREKIKSVLDIARKAEDELRTEQNRASISKVAIKTEFDFFKYRDIVPKVHEIILRTLPNEKNNPEQAWLYEAFSAGDVRKVKEIRRKERKQLFITGMSIYYTQNLETAQFGSVGSQRGADNKAGGVPAGGEAAFYEEMMTRMRGGGGGGDSSKGASADRGVAGARTPGTGAPAGDRGFVVTIAGYSPYEEIVELLDPIGAQDDANKWGFVTRLIHFDSMFDGNSPFELYKKMDKKHFELQTGEVDLAAQMPPGIGVIKAVAGKDTVLEQMLIDPMTKEAISRQVSVDEAGKKETDRQGNSVYQANDHWFVLNLKLKWKDAPSTLNATVQTMGDGGATRDNGRTTKAQGSKSKTKAKSKVGGGKKSNVEF